MRVFAKKGFHGARVGDVAAEAGVAHGLVYHYFSSKDELLETIFRDTWTALLAAMREVEESDDPAREQLRKVGAIVLRTWTRDPDLVRVLVNEVTRGARLQREIAEIRQAFEAIERIVASGQARGRAPERPRRAARGVRLLRRARGDPHRLAPRRAGGGRRRGGAGRRGHRLRRARSGSRPARDDADSRPEDRPPGDAPQPRLDPRPRRLRPRVRPHDHRRLPAAAPRRFTNSTTLIALVLAAEGLFALTLPVVIGPWSDTFHTPLGRRRPFMLVALGPMGFSLALVAFMPSFWTTALMVFAFFFAYYVYEPPYRGLYPDLLPGGPLRLVAVGAARAPRRRARRRPHRRRPPLPRLGAVAVPRRRVRRRRRVRDPRVLGARGRGPRTGLPRRARLRADELARLPRRAARAALPDRERGLGGDLRRRRGRSSCST